MSYLVSSPHFPYTQDGIIIETLQNHCEDWQDTCIKLDTELFTKKGRKTNSNIHEIFQVNRREERNWVTILQLNVFLF
jgi:hypothetical protein